LYFGVAHVKEKKLTKAFAATSRQKESDESTHHPIHAVARAKEIRTQGRAQRTYRLARTDGQSTHSPSKVRREFHSPCRALFAVSSREWASARCRPSIAS
jgi:hypothetical protein